jgi:hypothetical protein
MQMIQNLQRWSVLVVACPGIDEADFALEPHDPGGNTHEQVTGLQVVCYRIKPIGVHPLQSSFPLVAPKRRSTVLTEHRPEAYATLTPSRLHSRCTATAEALRARHFAPCYYQPVSPGQKPFSHRNA